MLEPMSAAALGSLITTICLATSGFIAVFFKGMSHSRCSKVKTCCFVVRQTSFGSRRNCGLNVDK